MERDYGIHEGASELGLLREGAPEHGLKKAVKNCGEFMEITGRPGNVCFDKFMIVLHI